MQNRQLCWTACEAVTWHVQGRVKGRGAHRGVGVERLDGGDVDDVALAGLLHAGHQEAREAHGRHQVDVRLQVPVVRVACSAAHGSSLM